MRKAANRKTRLREVPRPAAPPTFNAELPPDLPDEELKNVHAVEVNDSTNTSITRRGDICVVWMGHPFKSGDFGAVQTADETVYLGTLRHAPGGYVTLTTGACDDRSHTFRPGEYLRTGRAFSIERGGVTVKRFPL
jgi:hypothetical protein